MLTFEFIRHFVEANAIWAYVLTVLGVFVEGEIVVILGGIFAHLGSLNVWWIFLATLSGGILKSISGYLIGYHLNKHHGENIFLLKVERRIMYFLPHFADKQFWSIFVSRFFILGLNWFTLIFSGYRKVPLKIYARAEAISLVVWSTLMLCLGYFFSYTALSVTRDIRKFLVFLLAFFIAFFVLRKAIAFVLEFKHYHHDEK